MSRIRPPLTTSITVPVTTPSSSLIFSIVPRRARTEPASWTGSAPFLVLLLQDQGLDVLARVDDIVRVDVVLDDSSRDGITPSVL